MKKIDRLELIQRLVRTHDIETQQELLLLLKQEGLNPTQATVSRDMMTLGLTKALGPSGRYRYVLAPQTPHQAQLFVPTFSVKASIIKIFPPHAENPCFLALEVVPGTSRVLKKELEEAYSAEIYTIMTTDDNLVIVANTSWDAKELYRTLLEWQTTN